MSKIIAGRFDEQEQVARAKQAFIDSGVPADRLGSFFVNPAGQHDRYAIGGDHDKSVGAGDSESGVAAGAPIGGAVGLALGAAALPLVGPVALVAGALTGAHVGNLVGSLNQMDDDGSRRRSEVVRHAGMLLAVSISDDDAQQHAIALLRAHGACDIEHADGHILGGDWTDFDPTSPPRLVETA